MSRQRPASPHPFRCGRLDGLGLEPRVRFCKWSGSFDQMPSRHLGFLVLPSQAFVHKPLQVLRGQGFGCWRRFCFFLQVLPGDAFVRSRGPWCHWHLLPPSGHECHLEAPNLYENWLGPALVAS
uniref:Uncharacterized protein n=1 Tax=Pipistrellus kuhlii TaxID=59472 RepID=A0A7J7UG16_PIPKU|nr:hypothetical protein mPipKuh1_009075 [Pipistrellus kuhlii]